MQFQGWQGCHYHCLQVFTESPCQPESDDFHGAVKCPSLVNDASLVWHICK